MTDDEERTPLSEQDIALLKEIVRWRRANDIGFFLTGSGEGFAGAHGYLEWTRWSDATDGRPGRMRSHVVVERERPDMVGEAPPSRYATFSWHRVESVTQAVDVLVAYGHLPSRFSSAYRAGWDARDSHEHSHEDPDRDARRSGWDLQPDFPAVGPTC